MQTFSFLTFLSVLSVALYRARRPRYMPHVALDSQRRLRNTLWVILITSDLILLRTIFRLAETAQGESASPRQSALAREMIIPRTVLVLWRPVVRCSADGRLRLLRFRIDS
jgi:hypothetical protein